MQPQALINLSGLTVSGSKKAASETPENRNGITFFNNSDTTMYVSYGAAMNANGANCIAVPAGSGFADEKPPSVAIYVECASANKAYTLWIS